MNDVIGKGVIAFHTIQEMTKSRVKQLNWRGDAHPGSVCLVAAVIDGILCDLMTLLNQRELPLSRCVR